MLGIPPEYIAMTARQVHLLVTYHGGSEHEGSTVPGATTEHGMGSHDLGSGSESPLSRRPVRGPCIPCHTDAAMLLPQ